MQGALHGTPGGTAAGLTRAGAGQDKNGRLHLVVALDETEVDLKRLTARIGCGKKYLRMAAEDLLQPVLGVAPGCVTPLALANADSARDVVLLLDARMRDQDRVVVHPLTNTASTALAPAGLEQFLRALGREVRYVDFAADPVVNKDNPPDLKAFVESFAPHPLLAKPAGEASTNGGGGGGAGSGGGGGQEGKKAKKKKQAAAKKPPPPALEGWVAAPGGRPCSRGRGTDAAARSRDDVLAMVAELLPRLAAACQGAGGGAVSAAGLAGALEADLVGELNTLRNTAYTRGYLAGKAELAAKLHPRGR